MSRPPPALGVRHVALAVRDLPRARDFYGRVLGFQAYHVTDEDWAMFQMGTTTLSLILHHGKEAAADRSAVHPAHFGLNVESNGAVDQWHRYLTDRKAAGLTPPSLHRDGSYGFYLKDSEGNSLEVIFIPELPHSRG